MNLRGLRPRNVSDEGVVPNPNDPASVPPSTVGPDQLVVPGDPHGVTVTGPPDQGAGSPPRILPSAWSGWPSDWWPPLWGASSSLSSLSTTAWMCIDYNASALSSFPPYLVGAGPSLNADWINNPNPDLYTDWHEFAKQLFEGYQAAGEVFVFADSYYATGWPARFHVLPVWTVAVTMQDGRRYYEISGVDVTDRILHIRYSSNTIYPHGIGPLEAGQAWIVASQVLTQYVTGLASSGGIPSSILMHPEEISAEQAAALQTQWVTARMNTLGQPAVLGGGLTWQPTQMNPKDMALLDLQSMNDTRICSLLGVPPFLVGVQEEGTSMTYRNVLNVFDQHWRASLRPKAQAVMSALSGWVLPRGVSVELNRDAYVEPDPLARAQTYQILNAIVDAQGTPAMSVQEIRQAERLSNSTPSDDLAGGVLK